MSGGVQTVDRLLHHRFPEGRQPAVLWGLRVQITKDIRYVVHELQAAHAVLPTCCRVAVRQSPFNQLHRARIDRKTTHPVRRSASWGYDLRNGTPNDSPDYHLLGASIIGDDTKESISLTIK